MTRPLKVGVLGANGRMGRRVCAAVDVAPDLELAAVIGRGDSLDPLADTDVAVDVSVPDAVLGHVEYALAHGVHIVVGTSGVGAAERARIAELAEAAPGIGVHVVPNFSIAAVLAMKLAAQAAPYFDDIEILEYAGPHKLDAPAATAERTAYTLSRARSGSGPDIPEGRASTRGRSVYGVPVHSLRLAGVVSRQDVQLSRDGEGLTIHFETLDRDAFMPGVLLAVRSLPHRPGLTEGLEAILHTGGTS